MCGRVPPVPALVAVHRGPESQGVPPDGLVRRIVPAYPHTRADPNLTPTLPTSVPAPHPTPPSPPPSPRRICSAGSW